MAFVCMEAEESSALSRITTGRLDMLGRYGARFVLVNRRPTQVYDRKRYCRHDSTKVMSVAISQANCLQET